MAGWLIFGLAATLLRVLSSSTDWTVSKVAFLVGWVPGRRSIGHSYDFVKDPAGPINPVEQTSLNQAFSGKAEQGNRVFQKRKHSFLHPVTAADSLADLRGYVVSGKRSRNQWMLCGKDTKACMFGTKVWQRLEGIREGPCEAAFRQAWKRSCL